MILVVEDNDELRHALREYLETSGHKTCAVADGETVLDYDASQAGEIDLLVTDWMLPGVSGLAVIEHLWRYNAAIAVILISALAASATSTPLNAPGRIQYLRKPFSLRSLGAVVDQSLADVTRAQPAGNELS